MDFPIFDLPFFGNRMLIAFIGVVHVLLSHGVAIGGSAAVVLLEAKSLREQNPQMRQLAHRLMRIFLILFTSAGAITGVGIWFSTAVVSPAGIGSLLRIFFWAWFFEWTVFTAELIIILIYYLTWEKMNPRRHLRLGAAYIVVSWLTMLIIVGVLGAMLTPGRWTATRAFWDGYFNPTFMPQLMTRTALAGVLSMVIVLFTLLFMKIPPKLRASVNRFIGQWLIFFTPFYLIGVLSYYHMLPEQVAQRMPVAMMTRKFADHMAYGRSYYFLVVAVLFGTGLLLYFTRRHYVLFAVLPLLLMSGAVAQFERVREFVRKPYIIYDFMYSNGIHKEHAPFLNAGGALPYASWGRWRAGGDDTATRRGEALYRMQCAMCHPDTGINGITRKTSVLKDETTILRFLGSYQKSHPYMPPFLGTEQEAGDLAVFLDRLIDRSGTRDSESGRSLPGGEEGH